MLIIKCTFFQSQQQGPDTILIANAKGSKGRGKGKGKKTEEQVLSAPNKDILVSTISSIIIFRYLYDLLSPRLQLPPFWVQVER
jgi:hypothetical protein